MNANRSLLALLPLALVGLLAAPLAAQTTFPMIGSAFPLGVQRGKTTEVTVATGGQGGTNVYGAYKVIFAGEGVKADIVVPDKGWPAKDPKNQWALPGVSEVKMRVTVAADAPLGLREFRLATPRHGISSIGQLLITDGAEINEVEPNNDAEHAQAITLPCNIDGRIQQGEDIDCYKFKATAGQEVVFTVMCARAEDKIHDLQEHADPILTLTDTAGKTLAENDDYYRADPMLHYKFDKAGDYILRLRDVSYKGNPYWSYHLAISTGPYVLSALPCAVRPGQGVDLQVGGFNLGEARTVHLDVPANTPPGIWNTPLKFANGWSNTIPLLVSPAPQTLSAARPAANSGHTGVVAASLNGATASGPASRLTLPGGVNAVLTAPGQIDRYSFHTKAGQPWGFEVTARRLDSEMDSELKLRDSKGAVLAENDDAFGKDSRIDWTAPAEGDYTIEVRDLTGHAGPTYFYNLTAQPLRPDFALKCDTDRAMIAPGNRTAWFVILERKYGFGGDVKVEAQGLPAGVTASPLTIPAALGQGVLLLSAAPDAKVDMAAVHIVGTAMLPGPDGKPAPAQRIATPLTEIYMPGGGRGLMEVQTEGVAITETNDIEVTLNMAQVTLKPGSEAKIEVTIKRRPDYDKPVTLDFRVNHLGGVFTNPLPPGVTCDDAVTIGEKQTKGVVTLRAAADAKPIKDWPLAVMANVSVNFVMKVWYAAPLSLTIEAAPAKK
jgi:hypothetical protein